MSRITALIAEDENLLAAGLQADLARLWPELSVVATVSHGVAAVSRALECRPDVLFLDIRMPGMTGLEAAQALAEDWPDGAFFPLIVFVTAYDQYAVQAFEQAAVDYLLKPVRPQRLAQCCARLQAALAQRDSSSTADTAVGPPGPLDAGFQATLDQLRGLLGAHGLSLGQSAGQLPGQPATPAAPLTLIQASAGGAIHMVPVDEVLYFEAADKYVRVITVQREHLIRTSLRELLPQLDAQRFWQVHRGTVVRASAIATAVRLDNGTLTLTLHGSADKLTVSRLYAALFKGM